MTFSRILHPVEYSDDGKHVAAQALALAGSCRADLHVLHAQSRRYSSEREAAEQSRLLEFVSNQNPDEVTFESAIVYGDPVSSVAKYARLTAPDLVLVGKTGRRGSRLWRAGVFARELAIAIRRPTLVMRAEQNRPRADSQPLFRNILCPIDFLPAAVAALRQSVALAKHGGRLTALHVLDGFPNEAVYSASEAFGRLDEYLNGLDSCDVQTLVVSGVPDEEILSAALEIKPDLIVIGLPIRGRFDAVVMRSTASVVVRRANCAVLMVPDPANRTELMPSTRAFLSSEA